MKRGIREMIGKSGAGCQECGSSGTKLFVQSSKNSAKSNRMIPVQILSEHSKTLRLYVGKRLPDYISNLIYAAKRVIHQFQGDFLKFVAHLVHKQPLPQKSAVDFVAQSTQFSGKGLNTSRSDDLQTCVAKRIIYVLSGTMNLSRKWRISGIKLAEWQQNLKLGETLHVS